MKILDTIFAVVDLVIIGVIIISLVKVLGAKKYWSYWEQFLRSKEVLPIPTMQFSLEKKAQGKKYLKVAGLFLLILIVLILVQIWIN